MQRIFTEVIIEQISDIFVVRQAFRLRIEFIEALTRLVIDSDPDVERAFAVTHIDIVWL